MPGSGKIFSDVTPNSDVDEDFFGDMGKRFVVAPQMDLAMFEFMGSNGKLEWFSSLCDKYYATCGDVTKMLQAVRTPVKERGVGVSLVEGNQSAGKVSVVKSQSSPAWRRPQVLRKFEERAVGFSAGDDNRYDFPNPGVVDAYGDGYCYLNLIRARDIAVVATDLGANPDLQRFFSLPSRNYIPVDFWKYRGVTIDQRGVHVSGSLGSDTFYGFASSVKHLFKDSVVLREISGEIGEVSFTGSFPGVTPRTIIGKMVRVQPKLVYKVENADDLFDASYRFVAPGVEVVGPDNEPGYTVDILLGSDQLRGAVRVGKIPVKQFDVWKCHKPEQRYSSGFCYLSLFQPAYRDSLAKEFGKNPEWFRVLKVPARALEVPRKLAALRVQVGATGTCHVGGEQGFDLRSFLASLVAGKPGLAIGWELGDVSADLPKGCDETSRVGSAVDLGTWLREFSPFLTDADVAIVSSSAALLGPVDKTRLRMLEAVGDAAITVYIAMEVARSAGTAEQYQNRRSSSASNTNLSKLFSGCPEMMGCVKFAGGVNPAVGVAGAKAFEAIVGAVAVSGGTDVVSKFLAQFSI